MPLTPGGTSSEVSRTLRLFAGIRSQQFLFGAELTFALGRDFADENVARLYLGAYADDSRLVEVFERLFTDVRYIFRDFFFAELRIARNAFEFLDVNRSKYVVANHSFA